jgi:hypothetical protein
MTRSSFGCVKRKMQVVLPEHFAAGSPDIEVPHLFQFRANSGSRDWIIGTATIVSDKYLA